MFPYGTIIRVIAEGPYETGCTGAIAVVVDEEMIRGEFVSGLLPREKDTFIIKVLDNTHMPEIFNYRKYWRVFEDGQYEVVGKHLYECFIHIEE